MNFSSVSSVSNVSNFLLFLNYFMSRQSEINQKLIKQNFWMPENQPFPTLILISLALILTIFNPLRQFSISISWEVWPLQFASWRKELKMRRNAKTSLIFPYSLLANNRQMFQVQGQTRTKKIPNKSRILFRIDHKSALIFSSVFLPV